MVGGTHYSVKVMPTERLSPYSQLCGLKCQTGIESIRGFQKVLSGVYGGCDGEGVNFFKHFLLSSSSLQRGEESVHIF